MLEWDLEVYKARLMKCEDSAVVEYILDSLRKDYGEEMEFERKAMCLVLKKVDGLKD